MTNDNSKHGQAKVRPKDNEKKSPERYLLRLFVAGSSPKSMQAIANIKNICEHNLKDCYQLDVIDLYQQPERARSDQIIAIPTLIKELPLPPCRIIGDLANAAEVCASLNIAITNCRPEPY